MKYKFRSKRKIFFIIIIFQDKEYLKYFVNMKITNYCLLIINHKFPVISNQNYKISMI